MKSQVPENLRQLFFKHFGSYWENEQPIAGHAVPRQMFRLRHAKSTFIGVCYDNIAENQAWLGFNQTFSALGLPVPALICSDAAGGCYLIEDLGDITLFSLLNSKRSKLDPFPAEIEKHYSAAFDLLARFQILSAEKIDYSLCYQYKIFDAENMRNDFGYFEREYLARVSVKLNSKFFENEREGLIERLSAANSNYFMYRDFQSRNIMIKQQKLFFIDFDRGRRGPLQYDLVSLLYQAQAQIPEQARERLKTSYLLAASKLAPINQEEFCYLLDEFALIRLVQNLGAYGKLGLGEGKEYFKKGLSFVVSGTQQLFSSEKLQGRYPYLSELAAKL